MAEQYRSHAARLPAATRSFHAMAELPTEELQARVRQAGERWPGAGPTAERPTEVYDPPSMPSLIHVLAADGSQIHPDRHSGLMYYLINIGTIHIQVGSGHAPAVGSTPLLFYSDEDLVDSSGHPISGALVNAQRDVAELRALADLAHGCGQEPCLALVDNGLILWLVLQDQDRRTMDVDRLLQAYMSQLDRLKAAGAGVAGVIDRPRHANVLRLMHLASLEPDKLSAQALEANPFLGLTDRQLFHELLGSGQRSARFVYKSPVNRDFAVRGHEVQFFYLRVDNRILRVEIPAWVGESDKQLGWAHAVMLQQSQSTAGFPYSLARAHELALVSARDREALETLLRGELAGQGLAAEPSTKSITKRWLSGRRRHSI